MKKLILTAVVMLGLSAQAQVTAVTTPELGTHLEVLSDKNDFATIIHLNYGPTPDELTKTKILDNGQDYRVQSLQSMEVLEGQMAHKIPLLAEGMPFTMGETVCLGVAFQLYNPAKQEALEISAVSVDKPCVTMIGLPKPPKSIKVIRE